MSVQSSDGSGSGSRWAKSADALTISRTSASIAFNSCSVTLAAKVSEQELKAIDAEVREIVNASADFAQRDPEPDPSELWTDVYR